MKYVSNWDCNKDRDVERNELSSFVVNDCYMHDIVSVFEEYRSETMMLQILLSIRCRDRLFIRILMVLLPILQ